MSENPKKPEELDDEQGELELEDDSQEVDYSALSDSFNEADGDEEPVEPKDEGQAEPVEPEAEKAKAPAEVKLEAEPEPAGETEEPKVEAEAAPTPEPTKAEEPEKPDLAAQRERWIGELESHFALSDDEATEIAITPEKAVPKLMAKMAVRIAEMMVPALATTMPQVIEAQSAFRSRQQEAENQFFERWPQLKGHKDRVTRIAEVHRKLNPTASVEEFIDEVGAQAVVVLRLSPQVTETKANGAKPSSPKARGTVPTTSSRATAPSNQFEAFAMELLDDD